MIEPLQMYAHLPGLLRVCARLEPATAALRHLGDSQLTPTDRLS